MVTKRDDDDDRPTDRVNIEQSAFGRWTGRVLQLSHFWQNNTCHKASICLRRGGGTLFGQITFKYLKSYTWVFPKASSRNSLGLFSSQIIGHSLFILLN